MKIQPIFNELITENQINEFSNDVYNTVKSKYPTGRIIMSKHDIIKYKPTPIQKIGFKPRGLWYGIGTEWLDWIRSEMPQWEKNNVFLVKLDDSKILKINNKLDLITFSEKYGNNGDGHFNYEKYLYIDWPKVAKDYQGIEISEYLYSARYDVMWYYGWDVASGCIWGNGVIKNINKIYF